MRRRSLVLALVALAAAVSLALAGRRLALAVIDLALRASAPDVTAIDPRALRDRIARGELISLVDARSEPEYRASRIPGAMRLDPDAGGLDQLPLLPGEPVVVYSSVGGRGTALARVLVARGFTRVGQLSGGVFGWANRGGPLVTGVGVPTARVHPVGGVWSVLLGPEHRLADAASPPPGAWRVP
ncbi:MAG: rhodanese-like domain-containing protein [Gemmatimonadales bacterium]|nr:rhodanese-like domain-containing protein [Gemmatimonadales bacterium]